MTQNGSDIQDYRWLVSDESKSWLEIAAATEVDPSALVRTTMRLRKELGTSRTHLVVALAQLRHRAEAKFERAHEMFFTRQLLEQATDEQIASYKAERFPRDLHIADLCCGIGGDLLSLAARGPVTGVDRDPIALVLAKANCAATGNGHVELSSADVREYNVDNFAAWHLDPDRRSEGRRSTRLEHHDPNVDTMNRLLQGKRNAAIKLAPAAAAPAAWAEDAELEWIGNRRECRQQVAWFGDLARHRGLRVATVFTSGSDEACTIFGEPHQPVPVADQLDQFVLEPNAAVLAAKLTGVLADRYGLASVSDQIPYLTHDKPIRDPSLTSFEILEVLQFDPVHIKPALRRRSIGALEIKKRGVRIEVDGVRQSLNLRGENAATLLITPVRKKVMAILAQRVEATTP